MNYIKCSVCGGAGVPLKSLSAEYLRQNLDQYYGAEVPATVSIPTYDLLRCRDCTLEFSNPMLTGDSSFYEWISKQSGYYPEERWEWFDTLKLMKSVSPKGASLLEIGCGSGNFLELLKTQPGIVAIGLDTESGAIRDCHKKGCSAFCEDLESYISRHPHSTFSFVVAFHCLEHVSDPLGLLKNMIRVCEKGGRILVSTPYSPMSFELDWFDPLNHPPHHMTRWNAKAYRSLAKQMGMKVRFYMPKAQSSLKRAYAAARLKFIGPSGPNSSPISVFLTYPMFIIRQWYKQLCREMLDGKVCADVVLVEFSHK